MLPESFVNMAEPMLFTSRIFSRIWRSGETRYSVGE